MKVPFEVIYEDNHLLIVNKASGILVQGDATGDLPLVELCKEYVGKKYQKPGAVFLGVVHRIDRPVSGLVILARTSKSLERMNALFRENQTRKTYWAITGRSPAAESGNLVHWLIKDEKKKQNHSLFEGNPRGPAFRAQLRDHCPPGKTMAIKGQSHNGPTSSDPGSARSYGLPYQR